METNITEVSFSNSYTEHLYGFAQYDRGQKLKITGIETDANTEVHFSLSASGGESPRVLPDSTGAETIVSVPDFVFCADRMYDYEAYAFVCYMDVNVGKTERRIIMHIKSRPKPADFAPPSEPDLTQKVLQELSTKLTAPSTAQIGQIFRVKSITEDGNLVLEAVDMPSGGGEVTDEQISNAVDNYMAANPIEESDPTVPAWAKQPEKPIYTASEIGADTSGTAESKVSAHNVSDTAHNDIRLLVQGLTERLNALANSDDTTLDQMSEVVAYIKSNKSLIDAITTSKVNVSDIIDNLTTNVSNKPLSAAQGVALKALIDGITTVELDETLTDNTKAAPAGVVGELKGDLSNKIDKPSTVPEVGKILKATSVNDDGTFVCDWCDDLIGGFSKVVDITTEIDVGIIRFELDDDYNEICLVLNTNSPFAIGSVGFGSNYITIGEQNIAYIYNPKEGEYCNVTMHLVRLDDCWIGLSCRINNKNVTGVFDSFVENNYFAQKCKYSRLFKIENTTSYSPDGTKYPAGTSVVVIAR